jgi:hypothetical protein
MVPKHLGADYMYKRPEPGKPLLPWVTKRFEMWPEVPVLAVGDGDAWSVGRNAKGSNIVIIDHHNVPGFGPLASMYIHLQDDIRVKAKQPVKAGQVIGFVGHTGTSIAHLHFALSTDVKNKWHLDPEPIVNQWKLVSSQLSPAGKPKKQTGKDLGWLLVLLAIAYLAR